MARLGHSTAGAALVYQHAAQDRDRVIAEALSGLADEPPPPRAAGDDTVPDRVQLRDAAVVVRSYDAVADPARRAERLALHDSPDPSGPRPPEQLYVLAGRTSGSGRPRDVETYLEGAGNPSTSRPGPTSSPRSRPVPRNPRPTAGSRCSGAARGAGAT